MAKKTRPINFIIPLHVYPFDIMISMGERDDILFKKLKKREVGSVDLVTSERCGGQYVFWPNNSLALIRLPALPTTSSHFAALSHEILHIVICVLRQVGMRISEDSGSDEAYTYLMSYLTEEIYKRTNRYYI